jgi:hypothetical protein
VIGDSTAAEGFQPNLFRATTGDTALNLGVPGGHLFLFEKIVDMAVGQGVHPAAIVWMVTPAAMSKSETYDYLAGDLESLKTELGLGDLVRLAHHTSGLAGYAEYGSRIVFRPVLFRGDLLDFASRPSQRLVEAARVRDWFAGFQPGGELDDPGIDFDVCELATPAAASERASALRDRDPELAAHYQRSTAGYASAQGLRADPSTMERFAAVVSELAGTAPVYLIEAPFFDPDGSLYTNGLAAAMRTNMERLALSSNQVELLPSYHAGCGDFADVLHLNRDGGGRFTRHIAGALRRFLSRPQGAGADAF